MGVSQWNYAVQVVAEIATREVDQGSLIYYGSATAGRSETLQNEANTVPAVGVEDKAVPLAATWTYWWRLLIRTRARRSPINFWYRRRNFSKIKSFTFTNFPLLESFKKKLKKLHQKFR